MILMVCLVAMVAAAKPNPEKKDRLESTASFVQPPFQLDEVQPRRNVYEVRNYPQTTLVKSTTPCLNQSKAMEFGYLRLWLFVHGYNYQKMDLPYGQIHLTEADINPKAKDDCGNTFSQYMYLAIDEDFKTPFSPDQSIQIVKESPFKVFAKTYKGNLEQSLCNVQARQLARSLSRNGILVTRNHYYCVRYEPENNNIDDVVYEVWIKEQDTMLME